MKCHLTLRQWIATIVAVLLATTVSASVALAERIVTTTVVAAGPRTGSDIFETSSKESVTLAFPLPFSVRSEQIIGAEVHLTSLGGDTPDGTVVIENARMLATEPDEKRVFGARTINQVQDRDRIVFQANPEAMKNLLRGSAGIYKTADLSFKGADFTWYGPTAQNPNYRPRLVVRYVIDGDAPFQTVGDRGTLSPKRFWPDPAPLRLHAIRFSQQDIRSYVPLFHDGETIMLVGDQTKAHLVGLAPPDGATAWTSDPIKGAGQHLLLSDERSRLMVLGGTGIHLFDFDKGKAGKSKSRLDIANFELDAKRPPVVGPDGSIYVAVGPEIHALDPNLRERWNVPVQKSGPLTLSPDGVYLFLTTDTGLRAIDTRTGNTLPPSRESEPKEEERQFLQTTGTQGATLHAPVVVTLPDPNGNPVTRAYASATTQNSGAVGIYDLTLSTTGLSGTSSLEFARIVDNTRGQPIPDMRAPVADGAGGTKSLRVVTQSGNRTGVMDFDWSSGKVIGEPRALEAQLPEPDAIRPVTSASGRIFLLVAGGVSTASGSPEDTGAMVTVPLANIPKDDVPIEPRLMFGENGNLYLRDANDTSRKLLLLVPEFELSRVRSVCSPTYAHLTGTGAPGTSITAGQGVLLAPGATLMPETTVRIGSCS